MGNAQAFARPHDSARQRAKGVQAQDPPVATHPSASRRWPPGRPAWSSGCPRWRGSTAAAAGGKVDTRRESESDTKLDLVGVYRCAATGCLKCIVHSARPDPAASPESPAARKCAPRGAPPPTPPSWRPAAALPHPPPPARQAGEQRRGQELRPRSAQRQQTQTGRGGG